MKYKNMFMTLKMASSFGVVPTESLKESMLQMIACIINQLPDDEFRDLMVMLGWEDKLL
jgi:hypothetical protein